MMFFIILIMNSKEKFKPYFKSLKVYRNEEEHDDPRLLNLGFPTAMQMLFEVGIFTATVWLAGTLGTIDQAANQIALNLSSMTFMIAVGMGVAATIRVGNQKGLQKYRDLRRISFSVFLQVFMIEFIFAITFFAVKRYITYGIY